LVQKRHPETSKGASRLLEAKFGTEITFDEAKPECIIEIDEFFGEHRNCDLVVLCSAGAQHITINIEAKADEPFGDTTVGDYYDQQANSQSHVPARIQKLSLASRVRTEKFPREAPIDL
jgi:hypothetical protein